MGISVAVQLCGFIAVPMMIFTDLRIDRMTVVGIVNSDIEET